jgi:hypothetical protein
MRTEPRSGTGYVARVACTTLSWSLAVCYPQTTPDALPRKPLLSTQTNTHTTGFRPPSQLNLAPNDLELYNIRNDGWCLITLALILLSFTNAVPFSAGSATKATSIPYAKGVVAATVFHHIVRRLHKHKAWFIDG